jgi:glycosyltransferase involved in cell wall biosynthesis
MFRLGTCSRGGSVSYRLALLTSIPVLRGEAEPMTLDLWARDLEAQVEAVGALVLLAPLVDVWPDTSLQALPAGIQLVDPDRVSDRELAVLIDGCDVIQVPGNFSWRASAPARRLMRLARRAGKATIVGISSDRARTELLNAAQANSLRRLRAWVRSASIRWSQRYLASRASGVFLVGEGLRRLIGAGPQRVLVGTASWIRRSDIAPPRTEPSPGHRWRLCAAARLERMKGMHQAIEVLAPLAARVPDLSFELDIAGVGPEEAALRAQAVAMAAHADAPVRFVGALPYPDAFFAFLREVDVVLLTNLNDEQPRLIFDAISQGCLPVCPDSTPYRSLGLPPELLYRRGDVDSLAQCLTTLLMSGRRPALRARLIEIANGATIEAMHRVRRDWVREQVLGA